MESQPFRYIDGELHCESVPLERLAAQHGTPLYVYSRDSMWQRYQMLREAFGPDARICYAVKSNSNLAILQLFAGFGAGFDLVSGGELRRLQAASIPVDGAVFAGVAKAGWEVEEALRAGILLFNLESESEIPLLDELGQRLGCEVRVAVRLNVDVDAGSHEYISTGRSGDKFGLDPKRAAAAVATVAGCSSLRLSGYHVHLGSLLHSIDPYLQALDRVFEFMDGAAVRRDGNDLQLLRKTIGRALDHIRDQGPVQPVQGLDGLVIPLALHLHLLVRDTHRKRRRNRDG